MEHSCLPVWSRYNVKPSERYDDQPAFDFGRAGLFGGLNIDCVRLAVLALRDRCEGVFPLGVVIRLVRLKRRERGDSGASPDEETETALSLIPPCRNEDGGPLENMPSFGRAEPSGQNEPLR